MKFTVKLYTPNDFDVWNLFVAKAKNSTFLFHRNFMEYHSDRFHDFSLMVFKDSVLKAVLPGNRVGEVLHSHQGLTFGGLLLEPNIGFEQVNEMISAILEFLPKQGIKQFNVKTLPSFYCKSAANEMTFMLQNKGASLAKTFMVLAVDYAHPLSIHKTKLKHCKRNSDMRFVIKESTDFSLFWNEVLQPRLQSKFDTRPVHSLEEIQLLRERFPKNIKQFDIFYEDRILAGITIFENELVVKSQYGATTKEGEKLRAFDYLFIHLIKHFQGKGKHYFSMGTVMDDSFEQGYNPGLLKQKEELGCDLYLQEIYSLKLA
ncbi:FemAB family protein [Mangrovimonas sp. YM274]|uniref:FemAB family protein n=1 Tax=Mangrovimonas sp. YM274 TaxID=3070660 RepID=UPI0027DE145B|nr:FemAB family protein [Mangrovimonas sp. YM274]WMI68043.1 FemAB family protein [Mangrovimonas sp. YM274]